MGRHFGRTFVANDLSGKGYQTKRIDGPAQVMFIELPPNFDFERWTVSPANQFLCPAA